MEHSERLEIFERVRAEHSVFLISVLWKLAGDRELFTEAMQYALLGMWQSRGTGRRLGGRWTTWPRSRSTRKNDRAVETG